VVEVQRSRKCVEVLEIGGAEELHRCPERRDCCVEPVVRRRLRRGLRRCTMSRLGSPNPGTVRRKRKGDGTVRIERAAAILAVGIVRSRTVVDGERHLRWHSEVRVT
jgi:hypothetical protein